MTQKNQNTQKKLTDTLNILPRYINLIINKNSDKVNILN